MNGFNTLSTALVVRDMDISLVAAALTVKQITKIDQRDNRKTIILLFEYITKIETNWIILPNYISRVNC